MILIYVVRKNNLLIFPNFSRFFFLSKFDIKDINIDLFSITGYSSKASAATGCASQPNDLCCKSFLATGVGVNDFNDMISKPSDSNNSKIIIGVVLGLIFGIAFITGLSIYAYKKYQLKKQEEEFGIIENGNLSHSNEGLSKNGSMNKFKMDGSTPKKFDASDMNNNNNDNDHTTTNNSNNSKNNESSQTLSNISAPTLSDSISTTAGITTTTTTSRHSIISTYPIPLISQPLSTTSTTNTNTTTTTTTLIPSYNHDRTSSMAGLPTHKAIYPYSKALPDELELEIGDEIVILKEFDDGWALGKIIGTGMEGAFPLVCIQPPDHDILMNHEKTEQENVKEESNNRQGQERDREEDNDDHDHDRVKREDKENQDGKNQNNRYSHYSSKRISILPKRISSQNYSSLGLDIYTLSMENNQEKNSTFNDKSSPRLKYLDTLKTQSLATTVRDPLDSPDRPDMYRKSPPLTIGMQDMDKNAAVSRWVETGNPIVVSPIISSPRSNIISMASTTLETPFPPILNMRNGFNGRDSMASTVNLNSGDSYHSTKRGSSLSKHMKKVTGFSSIPSSPIGSRSLNSDKTINDSSSSNHNKSNNNDDDAESVTAGFVDPDSSIL